MHPAGFESELFSELKPWEPSDERRILGIRLRGAQRLYDCVLDNADVRVRPGEYVVVDTKHGHRLGEVIKMNRAYLHQGEPLPRVIRKATDEDIENEAMNARRENDVFEAAVRVVQEKDIPIKIIGSEWSRDGSKVQVFFASEDKVDFKDLLYELGGRFHTRVEMRQVGIRDQAGLAGGVGVCGRELCCSSWLKGFRPISIRMAKNQNLALDNDKITGQCGRLLCCLSYEDDVYKREQKRLPKRGFKFEMDGERYQVISTNVLLRKVLVLAPDGGQHILDMPSFNALIMKPNVKCLSKVNFMTEEEEAEARQMAESIHLEREKNARERIIERTRSETQDLQSISTAFRKVAGIDEPEASEDAGVAGEPAAQPRREPEDSDRKRSGRRRSGRRGGEKKAGAQGADQAKAAGDGGESRKSDGGSGGKRGRRSRGGRSRRGGGGPGGGSSQS